MAIEKFSNLAITSLSGGINNSTTSITVASPTLFPSGPNFRIVIDTEILLVTSGGSGGSTWTVVRGYEGTTAISHSNGAVVSNVLTAGSLNQFRADTISRGTYSSRPTVGVAGRIYIPTDDIVGYYDDGTTWKNFGRFNPFTSPPVASDLTTWYNQGSATYSDQKGSGTFFYGPPNVGVQWRGKVKSVTPPFQVILKFIPHFIPVNYTNMGFGFKNTADNKVIAFAIGFNSNNTHHFGMFCNKLNSETSFGGGVNFLDGGGLIDWGLGFTQGFLCWKILETGSVREWHISYDNGLNWIQILSMNNTDHLTTNQLGIFLETENNGFSIGMTILDWIQT